MLSAYPIVTVFNRSTRVSCIYFCLFIIGKRSVPFAIVVSPNIFVATTTLIAITARGVMNHRLAFCDPIFIYPI